MPIYELDGMRPVVGEGTWVAPSAEIVGNVTIGKNCYIGFGAIIRADFGKIDIGDGSLIEEAVVTAALYSGEYPSFFIAGINVEPIAAVSATAAPVNPANRILTIMLT